MSKRTIVIIVVCNVLSVLTVLVNLYIYLSIR